MPQVQVIQPIQQQPKRLHVAAYARVSSDSSDQLNSLSVQVDYYTHLIQENPNWDFAGIYADEGITGTSTKHREQFNRLMEDCRAGLIDRVLVKSASRFARNTADALASVREMKSLGVTVVFEKEGFDTETANGEMILSMICAVAQEESLSISKNLKWGIRKRMQDGTYRNAATPFGYRLENHQFIPCERESVVVRLIFEQYLNGKSIAWIASYLNENYPKNEGKWHYSGIKKMLCNEKYIGATLYQKQYTGDTLPLKPIKNHGQMPKYYNPSSHTGIVSADDFQKVQQLLREKNIPGTAARQSAFTKMLYCADCGTVFSRKENASHNPVWICRKHMQNVSLCRARPIYEAELKSAFLAMCSKLQVNRKRVLEPIEKDLLHLRYILEQKDKESADIHEDIRCLTKKNHNLERIYNMGGIEAVQYWERRAAIERQITEKRLLLTRRTFNNSIEKELQRTKKISECVASELPPTRFDEGVFKKMVDCVLIDGTGITFKLINGVEFTEARKVQ